MAKIEVETKGRVCEGTKAKDEAIDDWCSRITLEIGQPWKYKGQMELYLRWLDRYERQPGEETPIGLILCAGKSDHHIELLELDKGGIILDYDEQGNLVSLELLDASQRVTRTNRIEVEAVEASVS